ncbi:MAG: RecX family transcriptional regulator [Oscillospiraceae bacterium]|nr:RecX family transcriptional regulator [Oscillospiraceae bacterium]
MSETLISDIKLTKKGNFALFCEEGFLFSLNAETIEREGISVGDILSEQRLEELRETSDFQKAKNKALNYLSLRAHSEGELITKLKRSFDEHTAAKVVERLKQSGLTDDGDFASRYAAELIEKKGASLRAAREKLRERGIDRCLIEKTLAGYESGEQVRLQVLIEKKYSDKLGSREGISSLYSSLLRRGFASESIRAALEALAENSLRED